MSEKKYYVVGVTKPEVWDRVHAALTQDGSLDDNMPKRAVECVDLKEHSPTRAVYLMTDQEVELLTHDPDIKFVQIDQSYYPDLYPPRPDELKCDERYTNNVKNYYNFSGLLPTTPNATDANRAGYQLLRSAQYNNPWFGQGASTVINDTIQISNTGRNIDVIVGDEGCWFGHVEFQNNPTGGVALPRGYTGGNLLPGNGTCDLLDVVLEGPYYIDPDWFNANPGTRLTTRWDGTIVPVESVARAWWSTASQRSSQFAGAGTVAVPTTYTRANCNGSNTAETPGDEGQHGTPCSSLAYGRTFGWAYNSNKWVIDAYGNFGFGLNVDLYFDVVKIFHQNKPINPKLGTRDPTVSSNSWGFRATIPTTGFYYYNQGTSGSGGVAYTGTKPEFMRYIGSAGDASRAKGEMVDNNLTTAGDELIASGVIFVVAAGNSNQQQVSSDHPNFNNYWSNSAATPLVTATHVEFGYTCLNTTNRRGFPQQLGKYTADGQVVYPAINIGALDDTFTGTGLERKVNYSDMGNQIDVYLPADGTLAANQSYSPEFLRYDQYASARTLGRGFSGICSASALLATTGSLSISPNTGNRITTSAGAATVTSIPSSFFGGSGLIASTIPNAGNNDDGYWGFQLPFNLSYNGTNYSTIFVGTNSYITFGAGSSEYLNLGSANPFIPKIMITARDNSAQRLYYGLIGTAPNRLLRFRWEGTNATSGTLGNPNMVWEATFYENTPAQIDLQIGVNANGPSSLPFYDCGFSGTSAACPVAAGLIATALETNRNWGWADVRTWLNSLDEQSNTTFYQGPDPNSANSVDWADLNSLMGGVRRVGYNNIPSLVNAAITGDGLNINGSGIVITFV
jgi:hypothetical protein